MVISFESEMSIVNSLISHSHPISNSDINCKLNIIIDLLPKLIENKMGKFE